MFCNVRICRVDRQRLHPNPLLSTFVEFVVMVIGYCRWVGLPAAWRTAFHSARVRTARLPEMLPMMV